MKNLREFFLLQQLLGKILGAFFGYLAAGGVGAVIGILIGNVFDLGLYRHLSQPYWDFHAEKKEAIQRAFFKATFTVMGHIAKADGQVSKQEIRIAMVLMEEMRLSKAHQELAKAYYREGKSPEFKLNEILDELQMACSSNLLLLKMFLDIQYKAAKTGGMTAKKIAILDIIFQHFGLVPLHRQYRFYEDFNTSQQHSEHQYSHSQQGSGRSANYRLNEAYAILELKAAADQHTVKKAYRKLMSQNHPDKLIAQGLPEPMIKMATERTQKIRKAYETVCEAKGWQY